MQKDTQAGKEIAGERVAGRDGKPGETSETKQLLKVSDLAAMLNCSTRHCHRMVDSGKMPRPLKLGGLRRWHRATIDQWLADGCPSDQARGE